MNPSPADLPTLTIVQLSDIHLHRPVAGKEALCQDRLERLDDLLALALLFKPDCVILSGDLTEDGFDDPDELSWAQRIINQKNLPLTRVIPGNHDVGDKPGSGPNAINASRLANWNNTFGSDHFVEDIAHWRLIGLNSLLVNSGLPEETQQLLWLDQMLEQASLLRQRVAIFMHEPPFLNEPGKVYGDRSDYWAIDPASQNVYLRRLSHPSVKLVASGHVHWHRLFERQGVVHAWCPSPAFIVDDPQFPRGGDTLGFMVYTLYADHAQGKLIPYRHDDAKVIPFHGV